MHFNDNEEIGWFVEGDPWEPPELESERSALRRGVPARAEVRGYQPWADVEDDGEATFLKVRRGKGAKFRRVPVSRHLRRELLRYLNRQRPETVSVTRPFGATATTRPLRRRGSHLTRRLSFGSVCGLVLGGRGQATSDPDWSSRVAGSR